jgi:hypothetical protein
MAVARDRSQTHRFVMLAGVFAGFNVGLVGMILAYSGTSPRENPPAAAPSSEVAQSTSAAVEQPPAVTAAADATEEEPEVDVRDAVQELSGVVSIPETAPAIVNPDRDRPPVTDTPSTAPPAPTGNLKNRPAPEWSAAEMQQWLLRVPEVSLQYPGSPKVARTGRITGHYHPVLAVIEARPDLRGLPVRRVLEAWLPRAEAEAFRDASVLLRQELGAVTGLTPGANSRRIQFRPEVFTAQPGVVARVMHQMVQVESVPLRKALVAKLTKLRAPVASAALAHRAVYEPLPELRQTAILALKDRAAAEYLPVFMQAMRGPWPPAADLAAEALTALAPAEAVSDLVTLLEAPSASTPLPDDKGVPTVRELVRINHSHNCVLCHAQSVSRGDGIRVAAPSPIRPLPPAFTLANYEGGGKGGSSAPSDTVFVRPDITYLRQEFSWMLPVSNPGLWPSLQRYDFLVRTRPAVDGEVVAAKRDHDTPQKRAIVRTLQAITGKDFGDRAADWRNGLNTLAAKGP